MSISLSFVFPVHNVEATLSAEVRSLLELLAELGVGFDFLLIDDGSTDDTLGEAREIERRYAQVRVVHRALRYGHSAAVQCGLRQVSGRNVMIYNDRARPITTEIHDLWEARIGNDSRGHSRRSLTRPICHGSHLNEITDFGSILEAGGLILIQRWRLDELAQIEDFVRSDRECLEPMIAAADAAFAESLSGPHYLSPAAGSLSRDAW